MKAKITQQELNTAITAVGNIMLAYENDSSSPGTAANTGEEVIILDSVCMPMDNFKALLNLWGKVRYNFISEKIDDDISMKEE